MVKLVPNIADARITPRVIPLPVIVIAYLATSVNSANRNATLVNSETAVIRIVIVPMETLLIATLLPEIAFVKNRSKASNVKQTALMDFTETIVVPSAIARIMDPVIRKPASVTAKEDGKGHSVISRVAPDFTGSNVKKDARIPDLAIELAIM